MHVTITNDFTPLLALAKPHQPPRSQDVNCSCVTTSNETISGLEVSVKRTRGVLWVAFTRSPLPGMK